MSNGEGRLEQVEVSQRVYQEPRWKRRARAEAEWSRRQLAEEAKLSNLTKELAKEGVKSMLGPFGIVMDAIELPGTLWKAVVQRRRYVNARS